MAQKLIKPVVTHVIFDLDGTIVNTEKIYEGIYEEIANSFGKKISAELKVKYTGMQAKLACEVIVKELNLSILPEEFHKQLKEKALKFLSESELMPGVEKLIRHLSDKNIPIAIATNSEREVVKLKMQNYKEILNLFHHVVAGDDVQNAKPDPEIYLKAAKLFDGEISPDKCLAIEDSVVGAKSGKSAGMQVLLVPSAQMTEALTKDATLVLKSLKEFEPEIFGLPKY